MCVKCDLLFGAAAVRLTTLTVSSSLDVTLFW
jgi:hypothetical protein